MLKKIIVNEIKQHKFNAFTITLFISLSTLLLGLAIILNVTLISNVNKVMEKAKVPHYMQMHSGDISKEELDKFASSEEIIEEYQLVEFVNFEDWNFIIEGKAFDGGVQDNGIVKQGEGFDYLLGENGEILKPAPSEIYVPEMYLKKEIIQIGDKINLKSKEFTVKGVLFDGQMSSPLSSSKRFLINDKDFEELKKYGKMEYLIEFRIKNLEDIGEMENAYLKSGLGSNGPALTYNMFKFINYISDATLILILLLSSLFTLLISFLSIKLTVLVNIEESVKEIGILKAIGIENRKIKGLYRSKFILLSLIGCVLGSVLALLLSPFLLNNIKLIIEERALFRLNILAIIISAVFIFMIILIYLEWMLYKINKISFMESLYYTGEKKKSRSKKSILGNRYYTSSNQLMAWKGYANLREYSTLIKVIVLCILFINFPFIIYSSLSSEDIISSMGIGKSDMILRIKQSDEMEKNSKKIEDSLRADERIRNYSVLKARRYEVISENGEKNSLLIENGEIDKFPIKCSSGNLPQNKSEIALSSIAAEQYDKKLGEHLKIKINGSIEDMRISGIYSDITNGGKTAKGIFENDDEDIMWVTIPISFENKADIGTIREEYQNTFKEASVVDVEYYIHKTFGVILSGIKKLVMGGFLFGVLISLFICILYFTLLIEKEKYPRNIQRVLGFSFTDILAQYKLRMLMIMSYSMVLGIVFSGIFSSLVIKMISSLFGLTSFVFKINPLITVILVPLSITFVGFIALISTKHQVYKSKIIDSIKEI